MLGRVPCRPFLLLGANQPFRRAVLTADFDPKQSFASLRFHQVQPMRSELWDCVRPPSTPHLGRVPLSVAGEYYRSFTLRSGDEPVVLLSAGIGVTPVLAMLHALAAAESPRAHGLITDAHPTMRTPNATRHCSRGHLPRL